jgi:hypothetical protein
MIAACNPKLSWFVGVLALAFSFLLTPTSVRAQVTCTFITPSTICPGDNAVFQGTAQVASHSFIDASQLTGTNGNDICNKINAALAQLATAKYQNNLVYKNEGVIDARGVSNLNCTANPINPWTGFVYGTNSPPDNVVLLPAGTIQISTAWTLPARTRLVGQGSCLGSACAMLTTIQACNGSTTPCHGRTLAGDILQMGGLVGGVYFCPPGQGNPDRYNCNGVVIEHLRLDGNNVAGVSGIDNQYSQELSYVNDVAMINIDGEGLILGATPNNQGFQNDANNSGPYSNLYISGTGTCVDINKTTGTRGIYGLTCVATAGSGAAILVDGANNTLEDVSIYGSGGSYHDGIVIGSRASTDAVANANLLLNITGDSNVTNLVHISCASTNCPSNNPNLPTDLTIMGVSRSSTTGLISIEDDLNGASLSDTNVGLYLVGEPVTANSSVLGYSRFTTSLSVPAWLVGAATPTSPCPAIGDLYSNTNSGNTLWGCVGAPGAGWKLIK